MLLAANAQGLNASFAVQDVVSVLIDCFAKTVRDAELSSVRLMITQVSSKVMLALAIRLVRSSN
jgi:hypothetical protein